MEKDGHTRHAKADLSQANGERVMAFMRAQGLIRDCPHEDHGPGDEGVIPTKLGSEVFLMLAGMAPMETLADLVALRVAQEAGYV